MASFITINGIERMNLEFHRERLKYFFTHGYNHVNRNRLFLSCEHTNQKKTSLLDDDDALGHGSARASWCIWLGQYDDDDDARAARYERLGMVRRKLRTTRKARATHLARICPLFSSYKPYAIIAPSPDFTLHTAVTRRTAILSCVCVCAR